MFTAPAMGLAQRAVQHASALTRGHQRAIRPQPAGAATSLAAASASGGQSGGRQSVAAAARATKSSRGASFPGRGGDGRESGEGASGGAAGLAGWSCVKGCGACCQLDKGELAPPVEEILKDANELAEYRSMVGEDGWCRHYDKEERACRVYDSRPRFCRVEADVFWDLYRIPPHQLAASARSFCRVSIADVYGPRSEEMQRFKAANRKSRRDSSGNGT